jgi:NADH-quinone oxidoreductase subunit L
MKITGVTCLIGALAIAGVFPLSGFWAKEEILSRAYEAIHAAPPGLAPVYWVVFLGSMFTAFLTAFYMFRLWFVAFWGTPRRAQPHEVHESPPSMTIPLLILSVFAIFAGAINLPMLHRPFETYLASHGEAEVGASIAVTVVGIIVSLAGIVAAWWVYGRRSTGMLPAAEARSAPAVHRFLQSRWYIDDVYAFLVRRVVLGGAEAIAWVDRYVVNGMVDGVAWLTGQAARRVRRLETGQLQFYALVVFLSVALAVFGLALMGWRSG